MATDYSKYGLPSGASLDPATGAVIDSNGNVLGLASDFGGAQQNGQWSAPSAEYSASGVMLPQGALSNIPNAGLGDFTSGADTLQKQGLIAGLSSLEGVPTIFNDAQGNPQYFYGAPTTSGTPTISDNGKGTWYKYSDLQPIQGLDAQGNPTSFTPTAATYAPSKYDTGALNRSFLAGNAMVLGSMAGAGALDAAMAGGAAAPYSAEAFPITGGSEIPGTALGSSGLASSASGLSPSLLARAAGAGASLLSKLGGAQQGTPWDSGNNGQPLYIGQNASGPSSGPWNTPTKASSLTWTPHQQAPVRAGTEDLKMLYSSLDPALAQHLGQSGSAPSNLGQTPSYFTYGSPQQTAQPTDYLNGAPVAGFAGGGALKKAAGAVDSYLTSMFGPQPRKGTVAHERWSRSVADFYKQPEPEILDNMSGTARILHNDAAYAPSTESPLTQLGQGIEPEGYAVGGDAHVPEFITGETGHYVKGRGDGQSDDIPAMLADGEYVFDADTVAALGNGSSDAGAAVLDKMRQALRAHKRSAPVDKIPPKSKSPLEYVREGLKNHG